MEDFFLNDTGELFIKWNITTSYTKLGFNELISELIKEYKHTGGVYDAFMQNDGKLIGSEKIIIIRNLREIIQLAIVLRNFLKTKYIKEKNHEDLLAVKFIDEYSFQLNHKFKIEDLNRIKSVKFWYEQFFKIQVLNLIEDIKKALEDKMISEEEAIGLIKTLDEMLLSAAILYSKLSYENLTK